jgi:hypothetical protein
MGAGNPVLIDAGFMRHRAAMGKPIPPFQALDVAT